MNIAVVTGASSGIGKEFVHQMIKKAHFDEIWVIARRKERLEVLEGGKRTVIRKLPLDLTKEESLEKYRSLLRTYHPTVKVLVNAAGMGKMGNYQEISKEETEQMIALNIMASIRMIQETLPYMTLYCNIINMVSCAAFQPLPKLNVYSASKAFMLQYSKALNEELKSRKICVTAVCPGWVRTEFIDVLKQSANKNAITKFPFMAEAKDVVAQALKDAKYGRTISVYGIPTKMQYVAARILPPAIAMKICSKWM